MEHLLKRTRQSLAMISTAQTVQIWEADGQKVLMVEHFQLNHHGLLMRIKHKELLFDGRLSPYY
jgi:hypothetical protein